uniref:Kinesin motor domain-containing protein n=1 Tax=Strongyloides stercoralis TaxID=6248 RepID=A0AAF5DFB9_STRER
RLITLLTQSSLNSARVIVCIRDKNNVDTDKCERVDVLPDNTLKVRRLKVPSIKNTSKVYGPFNRILDSNVNYQRIFYEAVKVHVDEGFNGIKSFVLSYGFSNSRKNDILFGSDPKELSGVFKETLEYINLKKSQNVGSNVDLCFSVFELCGDKIFDLLSDFRKEISIVSDDDNKLVLRDPVVLPMPDLKTVCNTICDALNKKSYASNTNFEVVPRSHVLVKLNIVTKSKSGVINYGEIVFVNLSYEKLIMNPQDKQFNSEIKAAKLGYVSLHACLEQILKNPQLSQSFRDSTLTRILRPALSGSYTSSMIFTVTTENVPSDATQALDIADKYRRLKCCSHKESLVSLEVRRKTKNIWIPLCDIKEAETMGFVSINTESRNSIQTFHQEIEENKKRLQECTDVLSKIEIDLEESFKICNEKNLQRDSCIKAKHDAINDLAKINCENCELKSKVDKLKVEIANLLDKRAILEETCSKYFDKLEKSKSKGICLLEKSSSLDKARTEMNDFLSSQVKDMENNNLKVQNMIKDLMNKHKIFIKELDDQNCQDKNNFQQIEIVLKNYGDKLDVYSNEIQRCIKDRLPVDVRNELHDKLTRVYNELLVAIEKARKTCEAHGEKCFSCIEKIIEEERKKIVNFFSDYKECLLKEISNTQEAISTNDKCTMEIEVAQKDINDVKKILEEVNSIETPSIDLTLLNPPSSKEYVVDENAIPEDLPKFSPSEKPTVINEILSVTKKIFGSDHRNTLQDEGNKENL